MKTTIKILLSLFLVLSIFSCEKESEGLTRITYYAEIDLEGSSTVAVPLSGTYTEPGYTGSENGVDKTSEVEVSDDINTASLGVYTVTYQLINSDGFYSTTTRTVVVYDPSSPADDFSGTYSTSIVRTESDGSDPRNYAGEVNITKLANGLFYVDCLLGGTYSIYAGYGSSYAMTGYITLNSDYTISVVYSYVAGWGDGLEGFQNGTYDVSTGLPYWESVYASGDIYAVTMSN